MGWLTNQLTDCLRAAFIFYLEYDPEPSCDLLAHRLLKSRLLQVVFVMLRGS